jgi:hypothetical protein
MDAFTLFGDAASGFGDAGGIDPSTAAILADAGTGSSSSYDIGGAFNAAMTGGGGSAGGSWLDMVKPFMTSGAFNSLVAGLSQANSGRQNSNAANAMMAQQQGNFNTALNYNRPDQISDFGSSKWSTDPTTGRQTQTLSLNDTDKANLDSYRQLQGHRLGAADSIDLSYLGQPFTPPSMGGWQLGQPLPSSIGGEYVSPSKNDK